jgi:hypothetical protein
MRNKEAGLDALLRNATRPASVRDILPAVAGANAVAASVEKNVNRMNWIRVPNVDIGHEVLVRESRGNRFKSGAEVGIPGFGSDEEYLARATQIDTDFNAIYSAVYGSARVAPTRPTPAGVALGTTWREAFLSTLERWRNSRDELRNSALIWGSTWEPRLTTYANDVARFSADVARVSGGLSPTPTRAVNTFGLTLDTGAARAAEAASGIATAVAVVAVAAVVGLVIYEGGKIL